MVRLFLLCLGFVLFLNEEETIAWSENNQLTWQDFKGPIQANTNAVATTASGITFSYAIKRNSKKIASFKTKIVAHFYPEKSWYKPAEADAHILAHEQFHFNITELHARMFRQRVANLPVSKNIASKLTKIHQEINTELSTMQKLYDAETDFSRNFEQQAFWQKKILLALEKLAAYKHEVD